MHQNRIETVFVNITIMDKPDEHNTDEFRLRHALHQIINEYQKQYGDYETRQLMDELMAYHSARVVETR